MLTEILLNSILCKHLKGHSGAKQTVTAIQNQLPEYSCAYRTDVKSYYESIDHRILLEKLALTVKDQRVWNLLIQYVKRKVEVGGNFTDVQRGISSGCPLSPLIASFYLCELDAVMARKSIFSFRYMEDIVVMSKTRWQLKRAIRTVNQNFEQMKLQPHPDKTSIGRITKGFGFLGYQFGSGKLKASARTLQNHICRLIWLYEQKKHLSH